MCGSAGAAGGLRQGGPIYGNISPPTISGVPPTLYNNISGPTISGVPPPPPMGPQGMPLPAPPMQQPMQPPMQPPNQQTMGPQMQPMQPMQQPSMPSQSPMQPPMQRPFVGQSPQGASPAFAAGNVTGGVTSPGQVPSNPFAMLFGGY